MSLSSASALSAAAEFIAVLSESVLGNDLHLLTLKTYAGSKQRRPLLFVGPHGSGKSLLAAVYAEHVGETSLTFHSSALAWEDVETHVYATSRPVVVVTGVDQMSAQDAEIFLVHSSRLPGPVQWIFTAHREGLVPTSLRARSLLFRLLPLDTEILRLRALEAGVEAEHVETLVKRSGGFVGPLDRLIENYTLGLVEEDDDLPIRLAVQVVLGKREVVAELVDEFVTRVAAPDVLLTRLEGFYAQVLVAQAGGEADPTAVKVASRVPERHALLCIRALWQIQDRASLADPFSLPLLIKAGLLLLCAQIAPPTEPEPEAPPVPDQPLSVDGIKSLLQEKGLA